MDIAEIQLVQTTGADGKPVVAVYAAGLPVGGVDEVTFGGDVEGTYMNVKLRRFKIVDGDMQAANDVESAPEIEADTVEGISEK